LMAFCASLTISNEFNIFKE
jgi:hypothetical protein